MICGVDEVGRGPLAGPVVAAAVILDPRRPVEGLRDSKKLSAKKRDALDIIIREQALSFCIAEASVEEIDELNILQATFVAMRRAVQGLSRQAEHALIDGNKVPPDFPCTATAIVGGDDSEPAIAAASILAKVYRDNLMQRLDRQYPGYGLGRHMGYPTKQHRESLLKLGVTDCHRKSFSPVKKLL